MRYRIAGFAAAVFLLGCASTVPNGPVDQDRIAEARTLYRAYEDALRQHRRDMLAGFYRPEGALIIFNGTRMPRTNAVIDSIYRHEWQGPKFFAFDDLHFETFGRGQVLVTGGFRWLAPQSADTARFVYLSVLEHTPDGPRIRLEHETLRAVPVR